MGIDEDHTIRDIDQNESDWIQFQLKKLRAYLEKQIGKKLDDLPDPTFLDEYFQTALKDFHSGKLEGCRLGFTKQNDPNDWFSIIQYCKTFEQ